MTRSKAPGLDPLAREIPLALALLVLGVLTIGTGVYFMAARPPLLPEDLRFTGLIRSEVPEAELQWLSIVFRTWGGFTVGLGLCLLGLAGYVFTRRELWPRLGTAAGVLVAFGSFLASNIQLRSDHLAFIAVLFGCALTAALLLLHGVFVKRRPLSDT